MAQFASISGVRIVSGTLAIPLYGMWSADLSLATADPIPDNGALVLGNLSLASHVYRQAPFAGVRSCRVIGGFGGWRRAIAAKQYQLSSGVRLSLVLGDAAQEVGERVSVPADRIVGVDYTRRASSAGATLRRLAGKDWYIAPSGTTTIAAWPTRSIVSPFTVMKQDPAPGIVEVATEDYAEWMPNATFTAPTLAGTLRNCGVAFRFQQDGTLRLGVMTA